MIELYAILYILSQTVVSTLLIIGFFLHNRDIEKLSNRVKELEEKE